MSHKRQLLITKQYEELMVSIIEKLYSNSYHKYVSSEKIWTKSQPQKHECNIYVRCYIVFIVDFA